jgi:hypothetical protein
MPLQRIEEEEEEKKGKGRREGNGKEMCRGRWQHF